MTPQKQNEYIDMNKLTQRELLILLNNQVKNLDKKVEEISETQKQSIERITEVESKIKVQSAVWGAVSGIFTGIVFLIIKAITK